MSPATEVLFSDIAEKAISDAEELPVPFSKFVEGLQVIRDNVHARWLNAREEEGSL